MQRVLRSADQENNNRKRNAENINLMTQISEFDKQCNSKQEQLYMNTYQSQVATKMNFTKKKSNNSSPFTLLQGISLTNQYGGIVGQKKILQSSNYHNNQNCQYSSVKKPQTQQETLPTMINTQQSMIIVEDDQIQLSQIQRNSELDYSINNAPFPSISCSNNEQSSMQESEQNSILNMTNTQDSRPQSSSSSTQSNYQQKIYSGAQISSTSSEMAQYYNSHQFYEINNDNNNNNNNNNSSMNVIDINSSFLDSSKQTSSSINQKTIAPNSFRAGKNQQDTLDKIKKIRMRSHQSVMRGTSTTNKNNNIQNMSGNNNYAKLMKMAEEEVKEKSKKAIESIKNKLAINSENESVLVLKTQPQISQDEDYLNYLSIYQPNQTGSNFLNRKKNSCILHDSQIPLKPLSQNNALGKQGQQMSKTQTNGFPVYGEKPAFQMVCSDQIQKNYNNQNIQGLCITPNKSFQGRQQNKQLNKSIDELNYTKSDSKTNYRVNDENRKSLYKRMQNYNVFMRGKFAFHKLNKQKKELCNISNVLYNSLLENYEVEGMLKSFNPSLQNTQPKRRIYDAEDENENDSPDFNHMRKYYNKKYGIKLQQIESEKTSDNTVRCRNSYSNAHTPVKRNNESKSKKQGVLNSVSQTNSANQKYYSQSATTHQDDKFSQVYTDNLLNQSCTDFLNLCNLDDISQMVGGSNANPMNDAEIDNTTSTQSSKRQYSNNNSYNYTNFTQFSSAVQSQCQQRRQQSVGTKSRKKNDIELVPWESGE